LDQKENNDTTHVLEIPSLSVGSPIPGVESPGTDPFRQQDAAEWPWDDRPDVLESEEVFDSEVALRTLEQIGVLLKHGRCGIRIDLSKSRHISEFGRALLFSGIMKNRFDECLEYRESREEVFQRISGRMKMKAFEQGCGHVRVN